MAKTNKLCFSNGTSAENWLEHVRPLHPRRDWQRKPFWLRIRSNPFRRKYR